MMKIFSLLSLAAVAGGFGWCSSVMEENASLPPLRLAIRALKMKESAHVGLAVKDSHNKWTFFPQDEELRRKWNMILTWEVLETPGWRIDWCEGESARVVIEDSAGGKARDARSHFRAATRKKDLMASPGDWLPALGAQWIKVKGEIPFGRPPACCASGKETLVQHEESCLLTPGMLQIVKERCATLGITYYLLYC